MLIAEISCVVRGVQSRHWSICVLTVWGRCPECQLRGVGTVIRRFQWSAVEGLSLLCFVALAGPNDLG